MPEAPLPDTALDRTVLAEERTYSAWVRTGLASIATGLAIVELLPDAEPRWLVRLLGALLTIVGGISFALGYWAYRRGMMKWRNATPRAVPLVLIAGMSFTLLLGAMLALLLVLV